MGAVSGMFGGGGGAGGTGFATPQQVQIDMGGTVAQANDLYNQNQAQLANQQGFLNQITPYGTSGLQNQQAALQNLQDITQGRGPNLAQAQLQQATQQNIANQAALMAGQRGASQNVGLLARQAAMQGANTQQQAAGQAATTEAQQRLGAIGQMGALAGQQVGQAQGAQSAYTSALQGEQQNVLNAIEQQNSARAGVQSSINAANAGMANTRMGQQGSMFGGLAGMAGGALSTFLNKGGEVPRKNYPNGGTVVPGSGQYDMTSAPMSDEQWDAMKSGAPMPATAPVPPVATAPVSPATPPAPAAVQKASPGKFSTYIKGALQSMGTASGDAKAPSSGDQYNQLGVKLGNALHNMFSSKEGPTTTGQAAPWEVGGGVDTKDTSPDVMNAYRGGEVPAMVSPGEGYLNRSAVQEVKKGANPLKVAERIPGPNASGTKNSEKNDIVPKDLESGGIVLPKSVMNAKHPHWEAHKFVAQIMAKNGKMPKK